MRRLHGGRWRLGGRATRTLSRSKGATFMSTAVRPRARSAATSPAPADVFVVFGITGDLAKVMTFHSLYRLDQRGLLSCPIVGVAGDDWTVEDVREHARKCIQDCGETIDDAVFDRFAARLSYLSGDFGDDGTY